MELNSFSILIILYIITACRIKVTIREYTSNTISVGKQSESTQATQYQSGNLKSYTNIDSDNFLIISENDFDLLSIIIIFNFNYSGKYTTYTNPYKRHASLRK
jgi:hypothetical protein